MKVCKFIFHLNSRLKLKAGGARDQLIDATAKVRFTQAREAGENRAHLVSIALTNEGR